jgi:DNA helicase II / ATP-dependent DNA helicase PcrA
MEDKTNLIFGPPGTGKTTELLNIVEAAMHDGYSPDKIAFVTFTRKAANEAKHRAMDKFSLGGVQLPWFKTLHSLAFQRLAFNKTQVMGVRDYINLCEALGIYITFKGLSEDGTMAGFSKGDRLFFTENLSRAMMVPLKELWERDPDEDIYWYELEQLHNALSKYKQDTGKFDFTDILYHFVEEGNAPDIDMLIVDEAQDLSPIQWKMVEKLAHNTQEVYIAGDDDQSIFKWAGASPDSLLKMPGTRRVLPRSYRVPPQIQEVASGIITKIVERVEKKWDPREGEDGEVKHVTDLDQIDMSQGTWLLLGRNSYLLDAYDEYCRREGYIFESHSTKTTQDSIMCILNWERLRKGEKIRANAAKKIYGLMATRIGVQYGFKQKLEKADDDEWVTLLSLKSDYGLTTEKPWFEAFTRMPEEEIEYFRSALRKGEKITGKARIKVSTIHGVKGGEADHVVIMLDMAQRTFQEYQERPDDEHRVWYVAVTRARKSLTIIQPTTNRHYIL